MPERRRRINLGDRVLDVTEVDIVERNRESVAEYRLEDGSLIRVSTPVHAVFRMDEFDIEGKPVYLALPGTSVTVVEAPDSVRRKM